MTHVQIEITATDEQNSFIVFAWTMRNGWRVIGEPRQRHYISKESGNNYAVFVYGTELTRPQAMYFVDAFESGVFKHIDFSKEAGY